MEISKYIDHTILKAFATEQDVIRLCEEAKKYSFKSVCINPGFIKLAKEQLRDSNVLVCTVIGFPLGANTISVKAYETEEAIKNGADEVDMVVNISKVKEHDYSYIYEEIKSVVEKADNKVVKVILETCYLDKDEIINASKMAVKAKANFVKTSTGFGSGGAEIKDIEIMLSTVKPHLEVKASGGIRTKKDFDMMVNAGATRIGTSNGITIMEEYGI